jgi:type VI secretion system secreted protein VgrG
MTGVLSINTTQGANKFLVLRIEGRETLSRLPEYRVDVVSNVSLMGVAETIDIQSFLGTPATVCIDLQGTKRYFNAFITRMQRGERHGRYEAYSIVLRPWLWFATRNRNSRVFQDETLESIVKDVLSDYGGKVVWSPPKPQAIEYCVQYNESDFDFVSRLLEDAGVYYYFEHKATTHSLVLTDSMNKHESKPDETALEWSHALKHQCCIMNWSTQQEVRSAKVSLRDHDYLATGTPLDAEKAVTVQQGTAKKGTAELYEYPSRVVQNQTIDASKNASSLATAVAKLRMEEATSLQIVYTGTTNAYDVATGFTFELKKARTSSENTKYLVVSTEISADFGDHEAIDDLKSIKRRRDGILIDLVAIKASGAVFRPERITPRPLMHGPQTATVVGTDGNEIEVDKHGRVQVQFHWDRQGANNQKSPCWVRVAQPWAGKNMGLWVLPRIGHEVVVNFIGGDPDRPIITGSVHNDANPPPYELPKRSYTSGWLSHSTKEGAVDAYNELRFSDEKDKEHIWLAAQKDFYRSVKGNTFDHLQMNETRKVKETVKEVIGKEWLLNVGQDVKHEFGKDFHTKVTGDVFTTGGATWQIKLADKLSVKTETDAGFDVGGKTAWKSGSDVHIQSGGVLHTKSTGNLVQEAGGKLSLKATADLLAQGVSVKIKGNGEVVIEGALGIKLVCGGSSIALSPAKVDIVGPLVNINCGGGGGSAGAAEAAAAAQPAEVAEAAPDANLKPDKSEDYDKALQDPFTEEGGGRSRSNAVSKPPAPAGSGAGRPRSNAMSGPVLVEPPAAGALPPGAKAAGIMAVILAATTATGGGQAVVSAADAIVNDVIDRVDDLGEEERQAEAAARDKAEFESVSKEVVEDAEAEHKKAQDAADAAQDYNEAAAAASEAAYRQAADEGNAAIKASDPPPAE